MEIYLIVRATILSITMSGDVQDNKQEKYQPSAVIQTWHGKNIMNRIIKNVYNNQKRQICAQPKHMSKHKIFSHDFIQLNTKIMNSFFLIIRSAKAMSALSDFALQI
jgi:hypothetical protein